MTHTIILTRGYEAIIDKDDLYRELSVGFADGYTWTGTIASRLWNVTRKKHTSYATCHHMHNAADYEIRLHRLVMCARSGQCVDHRDGNGLNCVRSNLRLTDSLGNAANRRPIPHAGSKYKGVCFHRTTGKYEGYIKHRRKKYHLGLFITQEEAATAYNEKAVELFGEFACLNVIDALQPKSKTRK